jgi:hypothetical protein
LLDGGFQPLSVGGDDAAAGEVAEHDCDCGGMVDGSVRQRAEDKARCTSANQCIAWTSAGSRASLRAPMER